MDYSTYTAEDFLNDESFLAYYYKSDLRAISFWTTWIQEHSEKQAEVDAALQLLNALSADVDEAKYRQRLQEFTTYVNADNQQEANTRQFFAGWYRYAAAVAVLVMLSVGTYYWTQNRQNHLTPVSYTQKVAKKGSQRTLVLSDGTKVILNAGSAIRIPDNFEADKRVVYLRGEAYFEVSHNAEKPFQVIANNVTTTVLGTTFNVKAYAETDAIEVALLTGSVKLSDSLSDKKVLLKPMQMGVYSKKQAGFSKRAFNPEDVMAWKDGFLVFNNDSFAKVKAKIERWFDVEVINESSKTKWAYTGRFAKPELTDLIQAICFAKKLNYRIEGRKIIIH